MNDCNDYELQDYQDYNNQILNDNKREFNQTQTSRRPSDYTYKRFAKKSGDYQRKDFEYSDNSEYNNQTYGQGKRGYNSKN